MYNCKPLAEEIKKKVNRFRYANDISMKITQIMEIIQDDKKANYIHTSILANFMFIL